MLLVLLMIVTKAAAPALEEGTRSIGYLAPKLFPYHINWIPLAPQQAPMHMMGLPQMVSPTLSWMCADIKYCQLY